MRNLSLSTQNKTSFSAGLIIATLLVITVSPVGFVFAQSGYWDVTIQSNLSSTIDESGVSVTVAMSGSSVLHLTVVGIQVSGSGEGNYVVSLSGTSNIAGASATLSAPQVNFRETDSVTGIVNSDATATLHLTVTATNAPSAVSGTITTTVAGQTVTIPISIPISSMTQTTSGTYEVTLEDGYTETTPVSASGVQGETSITVTRRPSPSFTPLPTGTPTTSSTSEPYPTVSTGPSPTASPTQTYTWGTVGLLRGSAAIMDPNTGQYVSVTTNRGVTSGNIFKTTSDDALMQFSYPYGKGIVDFGPNSDFQFIGIQQETNAEGTLTLESTVPPLPNTYTGPYEEGLIDEGLGPLSFLLMGVGGAIHGFRGVVVEGLLYLLEGTAHFFKEHSTNTDTYYAEPIAIRQGYIIPMGTEYTVSVSNEGATINVITGPVVFLDWKSGSTVQLESGQSLTLPNGGQSGSSAQDLQNDVSPWDSSSGTQWWTDSNVNPAPQFPWLIIFAVAGLVAAVAILAVVLVWKRRRNPQNQQQHTLPPPPPPPF